MEQNDLLNNLDGDNKIAIYYKGERNKLTPMKSFIYKSEDGAKYDIYIDEDEMRYLALTTKTKSSEWFIPNLHTALLYEDGSTIKVNELIPCKFYIFNKHGIGYRRPTSNMDYECFNNNNILSLYATSSHIDKVATSLIGKDEIDCTVISRDKISQYEQTGESFIFRQALVFADSLSIKHLKGDADDIYDFLYYFEERNPNTEIKFAENALIELNKPYTAQYVQLIVSKIAELDSTLSKENIQVTQDGIRIQH